MSTQNTEKSYYVGIDLGGSKILAGLFDTELKLLGTNKIRTKPERGFDGVCSRIARCVKELMDDADLSCENAIGLGIGTPGSIAPNGNVIFSGNLDWKDKPLKKKLEDLLKLPVVVENDCNAATLGIYHKELHAQSPNMVGIFLGTGIGAGLIFNHKLYRGSNHIAGEIGHTTMDIHGDKCNCGSIGCFELLSSRGAIFRQVNKAIQRGEPTLLSEMGDGKLEDLRSRDLLKAINRGDKCVDRIVDEAAFCAGIAVSNTVNLLDPDIVVLGGGVIEALGDRMMPIIEKTAYKHAFPGTVFKVIATELGDNAGITGAAALAQNKDI